MPPKRKATAPPPAATGPAESHTRSKRVRVASAARALLEPDVEKAPEPAVEEAPAPAKRGRKAKAVVEETAAAEPVEAPEVPEPAKRGRRPAAAVENAAEKLEEEEEATTSATASKKTTTKSKTQPIAKAEPKTKAKAKPEPAAETKPKAEPKPKAAKAKADSKPSSVKASPKPKKATTKTATASPGKASIIIATTSSKKSPAKTSPRRVPSPIKTTLAVPRVSKRAALSAGPATADYEADESRPATATATISPGKTKTTKVAAATRGRPKGTAKEKAASPRKAKASTAKASSSVSARGGRARRAAVEIEEDGGEGKEDEEEDEEDDEMDAGERRATPPRLNYGSVHKLAAWRLARDAPATKPARKGRAAAAGKAAKATTIRKRQRDEIAFPLDEGEDDNSSSSPNLHTLSLSDLQSLVASWSADGAHDAESGSGSISTSLIPSGPDHFPQQIATCTSALADIVSTLSSAVLAVQSERHAADALALRYAKFALWHHERVVRLAERLERELERVGAAADVRTATKGKGKVGEMRGSEMGEGKLAGAVRLMQRIRDWTDDGAVRCSAACQCGEGNCEECGRVEVLPEPEVEEYLPDYEDDEQEDEEEDVVIVVESQLNHRNIEDADLLQAHRQDDDNDRLDPAYAYGQIAALQSAFGGPIQPIQPAAARPASARSNLSTNGGHRPAVITTASLTYAQPSVVTAPLTSQSQLRPASTNSNAPVPAPANSALAGLISPTSPPYSPRDVDGEVGEYGEYRVDGEVVEVGEDTADDHLYDDLFESEAPMAALSGPLQSYPAQSPISPTNPAYRPRGVTYPSLSATSAGYQSAIALPSVAATSASYQPAHPLHQAPAPAHTIPTSASYQPPQSLYPQQPPILLDNDDVIAAMSKQRIREVLLNAPPYVEEGRVRTPPCDGRSMEEVSYEEMEYQGSFHGANEYGGGVPRFSPVASPE